MTIVLEKRPGGVEPEVRSRSIRGHVELLEVRDGLLHVTGWAADLGAAAAAPCPEVDLLLAGKAFDHVIPSMPRPDVAQVLGATGEALAFGFHLSRVVPPGFDPAAFQAVEQALERWGLVEKKPRRRRVRR